jgi:two-component system sensor histidine kinase/response regulator
LNTIALLKIGMVLKVYRKQNEQLQESQKALEAEIKQVESEKSHKAYLLGVLAHDVRNPVHNLKQLIELYHEKLVSKAEFSFLMSDLDSRVNDLQHTVEGILRDIKVDITRPDDDPILVNPITFTQELMGNMAGKFKAKHQTLLFDHPETVSSHLQIGRNASEVSIVLRNLLDNASKYSPEGSDIQVYLRDGDGTLQWDVQDAGAGVPAEIQPYLFRHNVPSQHGSGVGLYLCKSISESIRADLSYIPQPTGSLFRLTVAIAATAN